MEIQEPTLRALVLHYSWDLSPRYPDERGAITEVLRAITEKPTDWVWDSNGPLVVAWNEDRRMHLLASPGGLDVVSEAPEDPLPLAHSALPACMEILGVKELRECGAAGTWLLAAPTVADASGGIEATFGVEGIRHLLEPLGGRPSELQLTADFTEEKGHTRLRLAPAAVEELLDDGEYFLSDMESTDFPPAAIVARINRVRESPGDLDAVFATCSRLLEGIQHAADKVLANLVTA